MAEIPVKNKGEESNILAGEFIVSVPADTKGEPIEVVATDGTNKYEIVTIMRTSVNRYGNEVNFAEYRLAVK